LSRERFRIAEGEQRTVDIVDQTLSGLLDGVDHGAATVVTLGTTMAARKLWQRIGRRARRAGRPLGEDERALLAAEPGQQVPVAALRQLLQAIPPGELSGPVVHGSYLHVEGDYVVGGKDRVEGDKVINYGWPAPAAGGELPAGAPLRAEHGAGQPAGAGRLDVGIITVLSEETRAVTAALDAAGRCRSQMGPAGLRFREAELGGGRPGLRVVATQALDRGQRSAVLAFEQLRRHYAPATVVLVGIAGGISPEVRPGDVVVVHEVIYYDMRKERPDGIVHRGQARPVPAAARRAINAFFSDNGEPYRALLHGPDGVARACHVLPGPIGSGEAVVACESSEIRRYLTEVNDKTLALETEAGGVAQAFYETAGTAAAGAGWLAIRGISDDAGAGKDDSYHEIASWHAAGILRMLLPYLQPEEGSLR
jgi:adenosylhomocysteine nucleosidase